MTLGLRRRGDRAVSLLIARDQMTEACLHECMLGLLVNIHMTASRPLEGPSHPSPARPFWTGALANKK